MNGSKLKQFALGLCIVLSLFASSVAACGCAHHQGNSLIDAPSCHQDSAEHHSEEMPMPPVDSATFERTEECVCVQSAPRSFAKSEIVKIEKQAATVAPQITTSRETTATISAIEIAHFTKPFYLSDSFYNIKSPRAPPVS